MVLSQKSHWIENASFEDWIGCEFLEESRAGGEKSSGGRGREQRRTSSPHPSRFFPFPVGRQCFGGAHERERQEFGGRAEAGLRSFRKRSSWTDGAGGKLEKHNAALGMLSHLGEDGGGLWKDCSDEIRLDYV